MDTAFLIEHHMPRHGTHAYVEAPASTLVPVMHVRYTHTCGIHILLTFHSMAASIGDHAYRVMVFLHMVFSSDVGAEVTPGLRRHPLSLRL
jgi:hypothetical protein